jgi:LuxR family maltose regulon positive regulatory protein
MSIPTPSAHIIERPRLHPLMNDRQGLVLAGMAGYGKTSLLADASRRQQANGVPVWLGLDESDRSPVRLVSDMITAVGLSGFQERGAGLEAVQASALRAEPLTLVDSLLEMLYGSGLP